MLAVEKYLFVDSGLGFRPASVAYLESIVELDSDPDIRKFIPGGVQNEATIKAKLVRWEKEYKDKGYGHLLVFELSTGNFIGRSGFSDMSNGETEVGYIFDKEYWGRGYGTKTLSSVLRWASKNMKKNRIIAFTPVDHKASQRVMQKAGMNYVKRSMVEGEDCVFYEYVL